MSSQEQGQTTTSSAGGSYVAKHSILMMAAYLVLLCAVLFYCLVALWPSAPSFAITSVNPDHAPTKGGTPVDIGGTGFVDGLQVFLGDARAKSVVRKSDNLITVTTPDGQAGLVTIEIDAPDGRKTNLTNGFRFDADNPSGTQSTPPNAPSRVSSQTSLVDCQKSALPLFAWACSLDSGVRLLLIVIVVGALGSLIHVLRSFYWYVGNRNLRTSWLLMYFLLPFNGGGLALLFFLIARGVSSSQPTAIQASVGGYAALAALVGMFSQQALVKLKQIAQSIFAEAETGKDPAIHSALPKIALVTPAQGPSSGGTKVVIQGSGLSSVNSVTFGGVPATAITEDSDDQVSTTTPPHAVGKVAVEVSTSAGQKSSVAGAFEYVIGSTGSDAQQLSVTGIKPTSGPTSGGTSISLTGNGFGPGISVKVGEFPASSVSVLSTASISAVTPSGAAGDVDVEVTNSDGKRATLPSGFRFV